MRRSLILCASLALGCPSKSSTTETTSSSASSATPQTASVAASASSTPAAAAGASRKVADIGDVPGWSADPSSGKCTTDAATKTLITALGTGHDKTISDGTADVNAMIGKTNASTCAAARKGLANALNDGGYERYKAKAYTEADRWWRAALVVRPSAITSRYNLACGLALEGKPKDSIWAIQEIARAASEGDASAVNFLEKSKSDADLVSIRDDGAYKAAILQASALAGALDRAGRGRWTTLGANSCWSA